MKLHFLLIFAVFISFNINGQSLYFPPVSDSTWDTLSPESLGYCQTKIDSLYDFLEAENTKAFILLKDGKIVLEKYFGAHTQSSVWQWASAGKTITSFMTGIAQQEGYLAITDTTSDYLGLNWTDCTPEQEEKITIRHQLTMTSGLDDDVADPFCTLDSCLIYKADAGTRWAYHNGPYTLLDEVIENATGTTLNLYTTQKLKDPTGMTGLFVPVDYNNVFFSNARSMARFGLLILNNGNWNGNEIMTDAAYFNEMVNTSQELNLSYGYLWWLNGKSSYMIPQSQFIFPGSLCPNAPEDLIVAMGKGGQFLNIVPGQNLVWLRMGEEPDNALVPFLLNDDIWAYINDLQCESSGVEQQDVSKTVVQLFPNPAGDVVNIQSEKQIAKMMMFTMHGLPVKNTNALSSEMRVSMSDLTNGIYLVKVIYVDGEVWGGTVIKE